MRLFVKNERTSNLFLLIFCPEEVLEKYVEVHVNIHTTHSYIYEKGDSESPCLWISIAKFGKKSKFL